MPLPMWRRRRQRWPCVLVWTWVVHWRVLIPSPMWTQKRPDSANSARLKDCGSLPLALKPRWSVRAVRSRARSLACVQEWAGGFVHLQLGVAPALAFVLVRARAQVRVRPVLRPVPARDSPGQPREREVLAAQVHRVDHPVPDPPQAAHPPSLLQPPPTAVRPTADTDTSSIAPDRDNRTRCDTGTSCESTQCGARSFVNSLGSGPSRRCGRARGRGRRLRRDDRRASSRRCAARDTCHTSALHILVQDRCTLCWRRGLLRWVPRNGCK